MRGICLLLSDSIRSLDTPTFSQCHETAWDFITPTISTDSTHSTSGDYVVLLDEAGEEMRSVAFAQWLQKRMNSGVRRLVLMIGGPYGFSEAVYARANSKLSLSKMTFSHQIVRAIFTEQLYRAFTIIKGEPYHHE